MNIEKIAINGHYVWVDKDAEIKDDVYCLEDNNVGMCKGYTIAKCIKADNINGEHDFGNYTNGRVYLIIAASPELNLEGVPTYVEWLAEQEYPIDMLETSKGCFDDMNLSDRNIFIKGYQTAEKELSESKWNEGYKTAIEVINTLPTWDDVRKAIQMAREGYSSIHTEEEIIDQLKQSKQ